jgi:hypothetical protein
MARDEHFGKIVGLLIINLEKMRSRSTDNSSFPEELALEFDDWYSALIPKFEQDLTARQVACLSALNSYLDKISGEENAPLWTQEAFVDGKEWGDVRLIANLIVESFSS